MRHRNVGARTAKTGGILAGGAAAGKTTAGVAHTGVDRVVGLAAAGGAATVGNTNAGAMGERASVAQGVQLRGLAVSVCSRVRRVMRTMSRTAAMAIDRRATRVEIVAKSPNTVDLRRYRHYLCLAWQWLSGAVDSLKLIEVALEVLPVETAGAGWLARASVRSGHARRAAAGRCRRTVACVVVLCACVRRSEGEQKRDDPD
eukprot:6189415-Pleurochrysis_carterae.AAC.4